ncbi:MAG: RsmD family RNA methyltransferase [Treponema sp.]|jgi:16S rRNA (guanine(966)-N(2))-methyltransferase RsmD|nr:RsmD family RNA methyltransferase [Treponema sp.]
MRITGGILRGRKAAVPEGIIRPSMDRMRESVFAVLGDLSGLSFLDIFSGSGIIALEAASRGAAEVEAVEMDSQKRKTLLENVAIAPVRINCRFMAAELYVRRAKRSFDLIFCDPPFPYRFKRELIRDIAASPLVKNGTRLMLHRPREEASGDPVPFLDKEESREYGRSVVDFFLGIKNDHSP